MTDALLSVENIDFSYGPLQVLFDASIEVASGERLALLGTNGAGKSTLLRVVSGLGQPSSGRVLFDGVDITRLAPDRRAAMGLVQVAGGKAMFPSLTVLENLRLGGFAFVRDRKRVESGIEMALDAFPALRPKVDQAAGTLSGGEQQMVALGRAIVSAPKLLVIDELSLGLAPVVMAEIMSLIDRLTAAGQTMLVVEQSLNVALAIAERAYFMERGAVRFSGPTADLLDRDDLVRSVFFGTSGAKP